MVPLLSIASMSSSAPPKNTLTNHLQGASKRDIRLRRPARGTKGFEVKVIMQPVKMGGEGKRVRVSAVKKWVSRKPKSGILCGKCLLGAFPYLAFAVSLFFVFVLLRTYLVSE